MVPVLPGPFDRIRRAPDREGRAKEEGFGYIGIELEPEYVEIAEARLAAAERPPATLEDFAT